MQRLVANVRRNVHAKVTANEFVCKFKIYRKVTRCVCWCLPLFTFERHLQRETMAICTVVRTVFRTVIRTVIHTAIRTVIRTVIRTAIPIAIRIVGTCWFGTQVEVRCRLRRHPHGSHRHQNDLTLDGRLPVALRRRERRISKLTYRSRVDSGQ